MGVNSRCVIAQNPLWNAPNLPCGPNWNARHAKREDSSSSLESWSSNRFLDSAGRLPLLAPLALLFGRLFLRGFLFWLSFSLGLGLGLSLSFFRGSFLCRLLRRRLGSHRSRRRSRHCLRLFFADDQLLFLGFHYFAAQFVVFL